MKKYAWPITAVTGWGVVIPLLVVLYSMSQENQQLRLKEILSIAEISVLKGEVANLQSEPTYNDGYRDAIIKSGGGRTTYEDGYHAAILQMEEMRSMDEKVIKQTDPAPVEPEPTKVPEDIKLPGEIQKE